MENAGIYVHVPFCLKKCAYCDFYSVTNPAAVSGYADAVIREMGLTEVPYVDADTLYFGGGTPSLLDPGHVRSIKAQAEKTLGLVPESEITLETNPGTVDQRRLEAFFQWGVNRLHVGIQSFFDDNLAFLGRVHTAADGRKTLQQARRAGFENLGIDLIYGLPGQNRKQWTEDLKQALDHHPEHLSCYMLTLEKGTPLAKAYQEGKFSPASDDRMRDLFETTASFLTANGYEHYEISNFARLEKTSGKKSGQNHSKRSPWRSRHNGKYWSGAAYLGLGPSAHSFMPPVRHWNAGTLEKYLEYITAGRPPVAGREALTREQRMIEAVYLGLRVKEGVDFFAFEERFKVRFTEIFRTALIPLTDESLVQMTPDRCRLTQEGMLYMDSVAGRLVAVI